MTYLIDGYNLLWVFPPLRKQMIDKQSLSARKGMIGLLSQLVKSGGLKGKVIIVFDGRSTPGSGTLSVPGVVEVRFAPHPDTADSMIIDLVTAAEAPGDITVVSSDREIQNNVRRGGAAVMGAKRFIDQFVPERKPPRKAEVDEDEIRAADKPRAELGAFEVDMWLKEFGFTDDEGRK